MVHAFELAGLQWEIRPMNFDEQIEVECIMLRTFGPSAGAALRAAASGVIPMFIDLLREMAGKGEKFDLENLVEHWNKWQDAEDGTSDPRLRQVWDDFLGVLSDTGGQVLEVAVASLAVRVRVEDVMRLFALAVLSKKTLVTIDGKKSDVTSYEVLSRLLSSVPAAKWQLLTQALGATYGRKGDEGDA